MKLKFRRVGFIRQIEEVCFCFFPQRRLLILDEHD